MNTKEKGIKFTFSEPKENRIILEKQKQSLIMPVFLPPPTPPDSLQCRFSRWRPFSNALLCYLNTTKSSLNPLCLSGLMKQLFPVPHELGNCILDVLKHMETYSLLSLRLQK